MTAKLDKGITNDIPISDMFRAVNALIAEIRLNPSPTEKLLVGCRFEYDKGSTGATYKPARKVVLSMQYTRGTRTWNLHEFTIDGSPVDVDRPALAEKITAAATASITPKDTTA